jgi:uncharacterized membrane protein
MAPLVVLLLVYAISLAILRVRGREIAPGLAGRTALAAMFAFTGVSHFLFTEAMVEMLPPFVPERTLVVQATGVLEIAGAVGLLLPPLRRTAAWCLAAFLVCVFPANVYAAWNSVGMGGHVEGPAYLWLRAPLQLLFLAWTLHFGVRDASPRRRRRPVGGEAARELPLATGRLTRRG